MLDRIDLFLDVPPVTVVDLSLPAPAEGSAECAARVARARDLQEKRYAEAPAGRRRLNVDADMADVEAHCQPDADGRALMLQAAETLSLSARAYHRTLKVARTIADLDGDAALRRVHVAEALNYRFRSAQTPLTVTVGAGGAFRHG